MESKGFATKLAGELREAKDLIARLRRLQKLIHEVIYRYLVTIESNFIINN